MSKDNFKDTESFDNEFDIKLINNRKDFNPQINLNDTKQQNSLLDLNDSIVENPIVKPIETLKLIPMSHLIFHTKNKDAFGEKTPSNLRSSKVSDIILETNDPLIRNSRVYFKTHNLDDSKKNTDYILSNPSKVNNLHDNLNVSIREKEDNINPSQEYYHIKQNYTNQQRTSVSESASQINYSTKQNISYQQNIPSQINYSMKQNIPYQQNIPSQINYSMKQNIPYQQNISPMQSTSKGNQYSIVQNLPIEQKISVMQNPPKGNHNKKKNINLIQNPITEGYSQIYQDHYIQQKPTSQLLRQPTQYISNITSNNKQQSGIYQPTIHPVQYIPPTYSPIDKQKPTSHLLRQPTQYIPNIIYPNKQQNQISQQLIHPIDNNLNIISPTNQEKKTTSILKPKIEWVRVQKFDPQKNQFYEVMVPVEINEYQSPKQMIHPNDNSFEIGSPTNQEKKTSTKKMPVINYVVEKKIDPQNNVIYEEIIPIEINENISPKNNKNEISFKYNSPEQISKYDGPTNQQVHVSFKKESSNRILIESPTNMQNNKFEKNLPTITCQSLENFKESDVKNLEREKFIEDKKSIYSSCLLYQPCYNLKNEFVNSLTQNTNIFCNSKETTGIVENEEFILCKFCFRDFCKNCNLMCHKICPIVDQNNLKAFLVIEHSSSCQCNHNFEGKNYIKNPKLECFYNTFFLKILKSEGVKKFYRSRSKGILYCNLCYSSYHINRYETIEEIEDEDLICECDITTHNSFHCLDLFSLFNYHYDSISEKLEFSEMKSELKKELNNYLKKFSDKNIVSDLNSVEDYEIAKFMCHNLMFNGMLNYSLSDEIELMDILIEKLKQKDNYFYNNEKINMPLSYIFHFYRKFLFLYIGNVDENNIDVISCETRLRKLDQNSKFYQDLCKKDKLGKFFSIDMIRILFERLIELKYFYITFSNGDFLTEFLRRFFECYCYSEKEIIILLNITKKIKFKTNDDEFNNEIRYAIDNIYNIAQNNLIDLYVLNYLRENPNKIYKIDEKIIEKIYFYKYEEYFEDYFNKLFSDEKMYQKISNQQSRAVSGISYKLESDDFYGEKINYLNCLHFNFLKKFSSNLTLSNIELKNETKSFRQINHSNTNSNLLANIVVQFDTINILVYKVDRIEKFLDNILNECLPFIKLDQINNFDEFLEYLFYSLKCLYKNKDNDKSFKIDVSEYLNNNKNSIDVSKIDIKKFEEEIKYLFYQVFVLSKKFDSKDLILKKWNLVLFVFLSNERNIKFILYLRFINLLLVNIDYLKSFIFIYEENRKEKDFIWRAFYMIYKFFIHESELSAEFDYIIKDNFIDNLVNLFNECFLYEEERNKIYLNWNNHLIYYFLKIYMKKNNSHDSSYFFPYKFNTIGKSVLEELSIIASIAFETNFDVESYLNSIQTSDNFIKRQINDKNHFNSFNKGNRMNGNSNNHLITNNDLTNLNEIELENLNNIEEFKYESSFRSVCIENIKYLMLRLIGGINSTFILDFYLNLINKNFHVFKNFFENKNFFLTKNSSKNKHILKLEMVIVNFLIKFMILKCHNYLNLKSIIDTTIIKDELSSLVQIRFFQEIATLIDLKYQPLESKYLILNIKSQILELLKIYVNNIHIENTTNSDNYKYFNLYIIYNFSILFKEYQSKPSDNFDNFLLKKILKQVISNFLQKLYSLNLPSEKLPCSDLEHDEIDIKLQTEFNSIRNQIKNADFIIENHNKEVLNKFCDEDLANDYLKSFLSYDNRMHSVYSKHISNIIKHFKEDKLSSALKLISFKMWNNINKKIIISSNFKNILHYILKYIFNNLNILFKLEMVKDDAKCFNEILSENLLQSVNFINNLLYYYRHDFQEKFMEQITHENFKLMLKVIVKLNNYIIGISEYVDNSTLFSLSQKYFIFMDFFILICEGTNSTDLRDYFFQNFDYEAPILIHKEYNFYYQSFVQLENIINLINVKKIGSFSFGSFRLIIQFLYLSRFLKEFLEDDYSKVKEQNFKEIIDLCFLKLFDFNWLISDNIKNDDYSYCLRFELLSLLNAYLEEHLKNLKSHEFQFKINQFFENHERIFNEIAICFDKVIEDLKNRNEEKKVKFEKLNIENLKIEYLESEESLYKNKYFELAELYYKLLRLLDPFYQSFLEEYSNPIILNNENKNQSESESIKKEKIIRSYKFKNEIEKQDKESYEKERMKKKIYSDFLIYIGREIEVKFKDSNDKFKLRKIYFFKSPRCFWYKENLKKRFLDEAPRSSIGEKLDHFNKNLDLMLLEINICYQSRNIFLIKFMNLKLIPFLIINLDFINFFFVLFNNIFLLFYIFKDSSNTLSEDINSQIFNYYGSQEIQQKSVYILSSTGIILGLQLILYILWVNTFFHVKLLKSTFNYMLDGNYLLKDYVDEYEFKFNSFIAYDDMLKKLTYLENDELTSNSYSKESFFNIIWRSFVNLFLAENIRFFVFTILCHLLFIITKYYLLLVLPFFAIVRLYSLFGYFLKAILSKYTDFIALLIFIYAVEYIFSWLTFLHFQDFMVSEYKLRSGDLNEVFFGIKIS